MRSSLILILNSYHIGRHVFLLVLTLGFLMGGKVYGQTTNGLSDAEVQGRDLAHRILEQLAEQPPESSASQTGTLSVRGDQRFWVPITCATRYTETNWATIYTANWTNHTEVLDVVHQLGQSNEYYYDTNFTGAVSGITDLSRSSKRLTGADIDAPFAGSDFWISDLGLEFLNWPGQKFVKKDIHRSCGCMILESTNPHPGPGGYARIVSWIDTDTLGIVEAYAYDLNGKELKDFYPKNFKKINGHWEVETLEMDNSQTGSRSRLEFDIKK